MIPEKPKFRSVAYRHGGSRVKYVPIPVSPGTSQTNPFSGSNFQEVNHECKKRDCQYCRIMNDIEAGLQFGNYTPLDNDTRRQLLHRLASG